MHFVDEQVPWLLSHDAEHRRIARGTLFAMMHNEGLRSPRTAYGVGVLLGLIADPDTPERADLLEPMARFAVGAGDRWLPDPFPIADHRAVLVGEEVPAERRDRLPGGDVGPAVAVYDAVRAGLPLFRALVAAPPIDPGLPFTSAAAGEARAAAYEESARMRVVAAGLLGWFPEDAAGSLPLLVRAARERDPRLRATALISMGLLGGTPDPAYLSDPSPAVRVAAAIALARVLGERAPAPAAAVLLARVAGGAGRARRTEPGASAFPGAREHPGPAGVRSDPHAHTGKAGGEPGGLSDTHTGGGPSHAHTGKAGGGPSDTRAAGGGAGTLLVLDDDFGVVPFLDGDLGWYATASLRFLTDRPGEALDALLARLAAVDGAAAVVVLREVLELVFPGCRERLAPVPFAALDAGQRKVVLALAGSPASWRFRGGVFEKFRQPLVFRGLPGSPEAMRAYADSRTES